MKLVKESLNEFRREGDSLSNLGIGKVVLIKEWLQKFNTRFHEFSYVINDDLSIDITGSFESQRLIQGDLPDFIQFNEISGSFDVSNEKIKTFKGFPKIAKHINARNNEISSLVGAPIAKQVFDIHGNKIEKLDEIPNCKTFIFYNNPIKSLKNFNKLNKTDVQNFFLNSATYDLSLFEEWLKTITISNSFFSAFSTKLWNNSIAMSKQIKDYPFLESVFNPNHREHYTERTKEQFTKEYEEAKLLLQKNEFIYISTPRKEKNGSLEVESKNTIHSYGIYKLNAIRDPDGEGASILKSPFFNYVDFANYIIKLDKKRYIDENQRRRR